MTLTSVGIRYVPLPDAISIEAYQGSVEITTFLCIVVYSLQGSNSRFVLSSVRTSTLGRTALIGFRGHEVTSQEPCFPMATVHPLRTTREHHILPHPPISCHDTLPSHGVDPSLRQSIFLGLEKRFSLSRSAAPCGSGMHSPEAMM